MSERRRRTLKVAALVVAYFAMCSGLIGGFAWWAWRAVPRIVVQSRIRAEIGVLRTGSPDLKRDASRTLERIGEPAVPAVADCLSASDPATRAVALSTLASMGSVAHEALPALRDLRDSSDGEEQLLAAATMLVLLDDAPGEALREWRALAESDDRHLRAAALWQCNVAFEGDPERARAFVAGFLADPDAGEREQALRAMGDTSGALDFGLTDEVRALLTDPEPGVRCAACYALMRTSPTHPDTEAALVAALDDTDPSVVREAARQLMSDVSPTALEWAVRLSENHHETVRRLAQDRWPWLCSPADLTQAARDASLPYVTRTGALRRLADTMPSDDYRALLLDLLDDPAPYMRASCLQLYGNSVATTEAVPVIVERLGDSDARVRATGMSLLRYMGPKAEGARSAIFDGLGDASPAVRWHAVWAVARLGGEIPPRREALETLRSHEESERVRAAIADALADLS